MPTKRQQTKVKLKVVMLKLLLKRKPKKGKNKTSSAMDLVRKNQMAYEKFITKKVPKLLRALGVSSDSESSDEN
jgi:hypothetical protein